MFRNAFSNPLYKPKNITNIAALLHNVNLKEADCKLGNVLEKWRRVFTNKNIDEPGSSIDNIVAHVLNTRKISDVHANVNKQVTVKQMDEIERLCKMRLKHKPIQYIVGEWDFRNLKLKMREPVFIPRCETEQIVDLTLAECDESVTEVLELCCGSGAISIALLKANPKLKVIAIDKSKEAIELTKENAKLHGVLDRLHIVQKSITSQNLKEFLFKRYKVIVCNAPYVPTGDLDQLQKEIQLYEDRDALDGGEDGLRLIKLVLQLSCHLLEAGGKLILEADRWHPEFIKAYLENNPTIGLLITGIHKDMFNKERFITLKQR